MHLFKYVLPGFLSINIHFFSSVCAPTTTDDSIVVPVEQGRARLVARTRAVKEAFIHTWNGYQHCFGRDGFFPSYSVRTDKNNPDCGAGDSAWGKMAFQALNTAIIMELPDVVNQVLDFISKLDFLGKDKMKLRGRTMHFDLGTSVYMGSMLGAYDLLTGPYKNLLKDTSKVDMLLKQSITLADRLKQTYNTTTGLPGWGYLVENVPTQSFDSPSLRKARRDVSTLKIEQSHSPSRAMYRGRSGARSLSELGHIVLEWCHLSDLTGDKSYCDLAQQTESIMLSPKRGQVAETFPGLLSTWVREQRPISAADAQYGYDELVTWSDASSGYYEYLLKMYLYNPTKYADYGTRWVKSAESAVKNLLRPLPIESSQGSLMALSLYNDTKLEFAEDESSCSAAGYFILGGQVFSKPSLIAAGQSLLRTCHHLRTSTVSHLAPSEFHWSLSNLEKAGRTHPTYEGEWDPELEVDWSAGRWNYTASREFFDKNGFWYFESGNWLTKATPESYYYAYRTTGEEKYRDWAWEEFTAINKTSRVPNGFTPVEDVNSVKPGVLGDWNSGELSGGFFSGTLKYLFMIQVEDKPWQTKIGGHMDYVFSSDGNIFKTPNSN